MGITIGLATRNGEINLPDCLRSLTAQTIKPDEYVICIGPSNDKTEDLIQEFVKQTFVPTKIIYDKDGIGTGYARKAIVEHSTQEYVVWADTDYIVPPNWVEALKKIIEQEDFDCFGYSIAGSSIPLDEAISMRRNGELPNPIVLSKLKRMVKPTSCVMGVRRKTAIKIGNYDPYFSRGQGHDILVRFESCDCNIVGYNGIYVSHTWNGLSLKKDFFNGIYLRFLYKYGLKYAFISKRCLAHTVAFILRTFVVFAFPLFSFCLLTGLSLFIPTLMLLTGIFGLILGLIITHAPNPVSLIYYLRQLSTCFGEWYTLYDILTTKNRPKRGYGKKFLGGK